MFYRSITPLLKETVASFPVTFLTGPRQSGKTTLLRELFPEYQYVNLESPDHALHATEDARGFLNGLGNKSIIDEAQNVPSLFSYLQEHVDDPKLRAKFILSGSQNFLLAEKINQINAW